MSSGIGSACLDNYNRLKVSRSFMKMMLRYLVWYLIYFCYYCTLPYKLVLQVEVLSVCFIIKKQLRVLFNLLHFAPAMINFLKIHLSFLSKISKGDVFRFWRFVCRIFAFISFARLVEFLTYCEKEINSLLSSFRSFLAALLMTGKEWLLVCTLRFSLLFYLLWLSYVSLPQSSRWVS